MVLPPAAATGPWSLETILTVNRFPRTGTASITFKKVGAKTGEQHESRWKSHISIDPRDMGRAWDIIYPELMRNEVPQFKVSRDIATTAEVEKRRIQLDTLAKTPEEQQYYGTKLQDAQRLCNGMQVTVYIPQGGEERTREMLKDIERKLKQQGIRSGEVDESDKSIGK